MSWIGNPPFNFNRFVTAAFAPPNGANWRAYDNPEVERLLGEMAKRTHCEDRLELNRKLDAIIVEDAPWLFLIQPSGVRASSRKLTWGNANPTFYTLRNASTARVPQGGRRNATAALAAQ